MDSNKFVYIDENDTHHYDKGKYPIEGLRKKPETQNIPLSINNQNNDEISPLPSYYSPYIPRYLPRYSEKPIPLIDTSISNLNTKISNSEHVLTSSQTWQTKFFTLACKKYMANDHIRQILDQLDFVTFRDQICTDEEQVQKIMSNFSN
jgi:hypothetical protein